MQIVSVPAEAMVDPALNLTSIVERHASDTSNPGGRCRLAIGRTFTHISFMTWWFP